MRRPSGRWRPTASRRSGWPATWGSLPEVDALVGAAVDRFGGLDIIVNNAANALTEPVGSFSDAGFAKSVDVNLKGPVFLVQAALPYLRESEHASVLNVVSAGAWLYSAPVALYVAMKSAMVSFTKSMAAVLASTASGSMPWLPAASTRTCCVTPDARPWPGWPTPASWGASPLPRRWSGPLFLAAYASSYLTGTVVHADGGLVTVSKRALLTGPTTRAGVTGRRRARSARRTPTWPGRRRPGRSPAPPRPGPSCPGSRVAARCPATWPDPVNRQRATCVPRRQWP